MLSRCDSYRKSLYKFVYGFNFKCNQRAESLLLFLRFSPSGLSLIPTPLSSERNLVVSQG